jgi:hypothetical protein
MYITIRVKFIVIIIKNPLGKIFEKLVIYLRNLNFIILTNADLIFYYVLNYRVSTFACCSSSYYSNSNQN